MTVAAARLDLRLDARDKERIVRAAALRGLSVSAFVRDAVLREADTAMAAELTVTSRPRSRAVFWPVWTSRSSPMPG
jgi:uncharacterized protein (DUF1778 family)